MASLVSTTPELLSVQMQERETYECPVCLDSLLPPVYQCYNGHLICKDCVLRIQKCPTCRDDLPAKKIRNLIVEKLARSLSYECKNKNNGCPKILTYDELEFHLLDCPFMPHPFCEYLGIGNCDKKFCAGEIIGHLTKDHEIISSNNIKSDDKSVSIEFYQKLIFSDCPLNDNSRTIAWMPTYCFLDNKLFFIKTKLDFKKKIFAWMICVTGSETTAQNFVATIRITSNEAQDQYLEWSGRIFDLKSQFSTATNTFKLPAQAVEIYGKQGGCSTQFRWKMSVKINCKLFTIQSNVEENLIELTPLYNQLPDLTEPPLVSQQDRNNSYHEALRRIGTSGSYNTIFGVRPLSSSSPRSRTRLPAFSHFDNSTLW